MLFHQTYVWGGADLAELDGLSRVAGYDIKINCEGVFTFIDAVPNCKNAEYLTETVKQEIDLEGMSFDTQRSDTEVLLLAKEGGSFVFLVNGRKIDCDSVQIWRESPKDPPRMDVRGVYIDRLFVEVGEDDE